MRRLMVGVALVAALGALPAYAKDKPALKTQAATSAGAVTKENENRFRNEDGTFQGKPVVEGPANWKSASSGSASTGASSGESGSEMMPNSGGAK
jgi:hypothetical protein